MALPAVFERMIFTNPWLQYLELGEADPERIRQEGGFWFLYLESVRLGESIYAPLELITPDNFTAGESILSWGDISPYYEAQGTAITISSSLPAELPPEEPTSSGASSSSSGPSAYNSTVIVDEDGAPVESVVDVTPISGEMTASYGAYSSGSRPVTAALSMEFSSVLLEPTIPFRRISRARRLSDSASMIHVASWIANFTDGQWLDDGESGSGSISETVDVTDVDIDTPYPGAIYVLECDDTYIGTGFSNYTQIDLSMDTSMGGASTTQRWSWDYGPSWDHFQISRTSYVEVAWDGTFDSVTVSASWSGSSVADGQHVGMGCNINYSLWMILPYSWWY